MNKAPSRPVVLFTSNNLPSALDHVTTEESRHIRFVKPAMGRHIKEMHTDPNGALPITQKLAVRVLRLELQDAVPFHMHNHKEKLYISNSMGRIQVVMYPPPGHRLYTGQPLRIDLHAYGQQLVIPATWPHALHCTAVEEKQTHSEIMVISSPNMDDDIFWEEDLARLVSQPLPASS
ncbi:MAG: hypothetical protein V4526_01735 [Patescibacteria group bacterium]